MKFLLDSHVFVWMRQEPHRIGVDAISEMLLTSSELFLSLATIWELQIKTDLGKFTFGSPLDAVVEDEIQVNSLVLLPVEQTHIYNLANLPKIHGDPFDRLLISQAIVEDLTIVTADRHFSSYPVKVLW